MSKTVELMLNAAAARKVEGRSLVKFFPKAVKGKTYLGMCPAAFAKAGGKFENTVVAQRKLRGSVAVRVTKDALAALGVELVPGVRYEMVEFDPAKNLFRLEASDVAKGVLTDKPLVTVAA